MSKQPELCPECEWDTLEKSRPGQLIASLMGTAGVCVFIPIVGWVLIPVLLSLAAMVSIVAVFFIGKRWCTNPYCGWKGRL